MKIDLSWISDLLLVSDGSFNLVPLFHGQAMETECISFLILLHLVLTIWDVQPVCRKLQTSDL